MTNTNDIYLKKDTQKLLSVIAAIKGINSDKYTEDLIHNHLKKDHSQMYEDVKKLIKKHSKN